MEFQYILVILGVVLAFLLLYYGFTRIIKNKDLKQNTVSTIDCLKLLEALGGKENINEIKSSPSKLTVSLKESEKINIETIQNLGASGIVEGNKSISMIFGKQSPLIEEDLKKLL